MHQNPLWINASSCRLTKANRLWKWIWNAQAASNRHPIVSAGALEDGEAAAANLDRQHDLASNTSISTTAKFASTASNILRKTMWLSIFARPNYEYNAITFLFARVRSFFSWCHSILHLLRVSTRKCFAAYSVDMHQLKISGILSMGGRVSKKEQMELQLHQITSIAKPKKYYDSTTFVCVREMLTRRNAFGMQLLTGPDCLHWD